MKIITRIKAKELVIKHEDMVKELLQGYKVLTDPNDKDRYISNKNRTFFNKVNGVVARFTIRLNYQVTKVIISEGDSSADTYEFLLDDLFPKKTVIEKVKEAAKPKEEPKEVKAPVKRTRAKKVTKKTTDKDTTTEVKAKD